MIKNNILIDLNFLFHKNLGIMSSFGDPFESNETENKFVRKIFTDVLNELKNISSYSRLIICIDGKSWRKEFYPEYKGNRIKDDTLNWKRFYELMTEVADIFKFNGAIISQYYGAEADDLIYLWSNILFENGENCIILTADKDLYQCVRTNKENNNHIVVINNVSKTRKLVYHQDLEQIISESIVDIFNQHFDKSDIEKLYETHEKLIINKDFHVFSKVLEGDAGDNVKSVWTWINKTTNRKISPGIVKNVWNKISKNDTLDVCNITNIDDEFNTFHKYLEEFSKQTIKKDTLKENYKFNIKMMFLDKSTIPEDVQNKFIEIYNESKDTFINRIDYSILKNTQYEKVIDITSDIFKGFDMSIYTTDTTNNKTENNSLF